MKIRANVVRARVVLLVSGLVACTQAPHRPATHDASLAEPVRERIADHPRIQAIHGLLREREEQGMNAVALVRVRGEVLLHAAYGWADREEGRRMELDTGFDIGSLVKPLTVAAVLRLEELGKLSTADTLARFFPDAPADKRAITLDQVLAHTAGLPDVFAGDYDLVARAWLREKILTSPLVGPPGEEERYSNAGYCLLAMVIEEITGQSYEAFVREEVLVPLGAGGIGYRMAGWTGDELAVGYVGERRWGTPLDHPWEEDGPSWNLRGCGGMLGTAATMARWYEGVLAGRLFGAEAQRKFEALHVGTSRAVGGRAVMDAGGNDVFNTLQIAWADHGVSLTLFTSTAEPRNAETVWRDFADDLVALAREARDLGRE